MGISCLALERGHLDFCPGPSFLALCPWASYLTLCFSVHFQRNWDVPFVLRIKGGKALSTVSHTWEELNKCFYSFSLKAEAGSSASKLLCFLMILDRTLR